MDVMGTPSLLLQSALWTIEQRQGMIALGLQ